MVLHSTELKHFILQKLYDPYVFSNKIKNTLINIDNISNDASWRVKASLDSCGEKKIEMRPIQSWSREDWAWAISGKINIYHA